MNNNPAYNIDYFLAKFELIPSQEIGEHTLLNHCALWHCGVTDYNLPTHEAIALVAIFGCPDLSNGLLVADAVFTVNDSTTFGPTPKDRILNRLKSIKEGHPTQP